MGARSNSDDPGDEARRPLPDDLAAMIDAAVAAAVCDPAPAEGVADIIGAGQQRAFATALHEARRPIAALIAAAQAVRDLDRPDPMHPDNAAAIARAAWLKNVDMGTAALVHGLKVPAGSGASAYHAAIAAAISLLAAAEIERRPREPSADRRAARAAVHASYYWRYIHRMPLTVGWRDRPRAPRMLGKRAGAGELIPATDTARDALAAVQARGIGVDAATVKELLREYHADVRARGRPPEPADFMSAPLEELLGL